MKSSGFMYKKIKDDDDDLYPSRNLPRTSANSRTSQNGADAEHLMFANAMHPRV